MCLEGSYKVNYCTYLPVTLKAELYLTRARRTYVS